MKLGDGAGGLKEGSVNQTAKKDNLSAPVKTAGMVSCCCGKYFVMQSDFGVH